MCNTLGKPQDLPHQKWLLSECYKLGLQHKAPWVLQVMALNLQEIRRHMNGGWSCKKCQAVKLWKGLREVDLLVINLLLTPTSAQKAYLQPWQRLVHLSLSQTWHAWHDIVCKHIHCTHHWERCFSLRRCKTFQKWRSIQQTNWIYTATWQRSSLRHRFA